MSADDELDKVADSISDGATVDWNLAESEADTGEEASLRALRDVARIADFNRTLQRSPSDPADAGDGADASEPQEPPQSGPPPPHSKTAR